MCMVISYKNTRDELNFSFFKDTYYRGIIYAFKNAKNFNASFNKNCKDFIH